MATDLLQGSGGQYASNGQFHSMGKLSNGHRGAPVEANSNIIDIRGDHEGFSLVKDIHSGLNVPDGEEKTMPTLLLYDEAGLKLFEDITYLDDYYLTNAEIEVLETHANDIANKIAPGSIILELGSGNLRKVDILLKAIDKQGKNVEYYALDVSKPELERTLADVPVYKHVRCFGLWGTYDDGLEWLKMPQVNTHTKFVLSLGSSIGNFSRDEATTFLKGFADVLQPDDAFLIGIDACDDGDRIFKAYNDSEGVTHRFTHNGLSHANRLLAEEVFKLDEWEATGRYNKAEKRHEAFIRPLKDVTVVGVKVKQGEMVRFEESHKYGSKERTRLFKDAGVADHGYWTNRSQDYCMHLLSKKAFGIDLDPPSYASQPAPTWNDWVELWKLWDAVTRGMIPDEELNSKPIKLRNACIFYLGHIPTFLDIKLTDTTDGIPTEPRGYHKIFERGIDPDVDNPQHCHAHSEIPDDWPPLDEMLDYQERVRERVKRLYDSGETEKPNVARCLWLGYEHECMHLETLLYMLIQSRKTKPPPSTSEPPFAALASKAEAEAVPNQWFTVPESQIDLGLDDPEVDTGPVRHFGWDIEKPARKVHVPTFAAKARPITNGEYAEYLDKTGKTQLPASWDTVSFGENGVNGHKTNGHTNGESTGPSEHFMKDKVVKTVYGPVKLANALHWPVSASYDELAGCAKWMGGRIPTLEEARSIYEYVEAGKARTRGAEKAISNTIPAVNSHLVNNGVEESPPSRGQVNGAANAKASSSGGDPYEHFTDLTGTNVGFQRWHPMAVTQNGHRLSGQGDMGGLWEWTSTPLRRHKGYEPMPLYPAYSQDFFDEKHNVVLGGSWATAPRIAGRKSFVNWYQRNYPYVWAGARLVRDL